MSYFTFLTPTAPQSEVFAVSETESTKTYSISLACISAAETSVCPLPLPVWSGLAFTHFYRPGVFKQFAEQLSAVTFSALNPTSGLCGQVLWEEQEGCIAEAGPCLLIPDCISGGPEQRASTLSPMECCRDDVVSWFPRLKGEWVFALDLTISFVVFFSLWYLNVLFRKIKL